MPQLPYRAITESGAVLDLQLALNEHTVSPMRVQQLLTAVLECLTRELAVLGATSNGDLLQALAMALAIRAGLVESAPEAALLLARQCLDAAADAVAVARHTRPSAGHA